MTAAVPRRLVAEFLGSGLLVAAVVGTGIMGERLAGGTIAIALLANTIATGAALIVLILTFGPISGAHFNPALTLMSKLTAVCRCEGCSDFADDRQHPRQPQMFSLSGSMCKKGK